MKYQRGMGLIEVMIAMIILAIGILGVSGMQVMSLQQNRSALFRGEATQLANDLMDRLRVNTDVNYGALIDADPTNGKDCEKFSCTPTEMAAFDIAQWKCRINSVAADGTTFAACLAYETWSKIGPTPIVGSLPYGAGSIATTLGLSEVTIQWSDDRVAVPCGIRDGSSAEPDCTSITLRAQVD
jgi:type IV pilus modification protein PilV